MTAAERDIRPLTRHVLAWFGQWRRADPDERERLRKRCLGGGFAETLERLEQNVLAYREQVVPDVDGPLSVLLAGLSVPEPERVIHDLARAVYPDSGEWGKEQAAFEHLCRRLERHFPAPKDRPKPQPEPSIGAAQVAAAAAVREREAPSWKGKRMNQKGEPKPVAGEHSGQGLWASIQAAMAGMGLDPLTAPLNNDLLLRIANQVGRTPGSVSGTVYANRGKHRKAQIEGAGMSGTGPAEPVRAAEPAETPPEPPEPDGEAPERLRDEPQAIIRALTAENNTFRDRLTMQRQQIEHLRAEAERLQQQTSAPPPDREPAPVADLVPAGPEPVAASEGDRLTEEQRMAAFQLLGNCPGTIRERRRVLLLAADLATLAESR